MLMLKMAHLNSEVGTVMTPGGPMEAIKADANEYVVNANGPGVHVRKGAWVGFFPNGDCFLIADYLSHRGLGEAALEAAEECNR